MINTIIWQLIVHWFFKLWLLEQLIFLKYHPVILHYVNIWIYFALGYIFVLSFINTNFPGGSNGKAFAWNAGDLGSIPGSGRSSGEGNGNPLQYSSLIIPWTEEPGRLQSMGSQTVRHNWVTSLHFTSLQRKKWWLGWLLPHCEGDWMLGTSNLIIS